MELNGWSYAFMGIVALFALVIGLKYQFGRNDKKEIEDEYQYWKDRAGILLVAITVLTGFAFSLLGDPANKWVVLFGGVFGFIGILSVVIWHTKQLLWEIKEKQPVLLFLGSLLFGIQVVLLLLSFVIKQTS